MPLAIFLSIEVVKVSHWGSQPLGVPTCKTRLGLLDGKSWICTEDCGHLVIVTTHITNIRIKQTTVNTRQTRNGS